MKSGYEYKHMYNYSTVTIDSTQYQGILLNHIANPLYGGGDLSGTNNPYAVNYPTEAGVVSYPMGERIFVTRMSIRVRYIRNIHVGSNADISLVSRKTNYDLGTNNWLEGFPVNDLDLSIDRQHFAVHKRKYLRVPDTTTDGSACIEMRFDIPIMAWQNTTNKGHATSKLSWETPADAWKVLVIRCKEDISATVPFIGSLGFFRVDWRFFFLQHHDV